ncbi:helix-turn-helix transcriptional regulator [Exiguobacterium alkaliphilum]|uniref:helix-turn-helix transcriptional regulator n=1 Tax=Exiguobacterium alkaliphilum TaxID=1428684 RepID=UPI001BA65382|nr:AraC family transcriptional regulator [Exiguobacterium alkaliphilum]QUE85349.1 helix-turn-helix domain-containing protein [Exiguobacterium alkaliphilum]
MHPEGKMITVETWTEQMVETSFTTSSSFQIWLVTKGRLTVRINGTRVRLDPSMALMLDCGQLTRVERAEDSFHMDVISVDPFDLFSPLLAEQYVTPYIERIGYYVAHSTVPTDKAMLDTIDKAVRRLKSDSAFALLDATLQLAVVWRYWIQRTPVMRQHGYDRMDHMISYIHDHDTMKLSLEDIAAAGGLSRAECCRYFSKWGDTSPLAYVQDVRMQRAARLLCETDLAVAEVANQLGFTSVSHFVQTFKKIHNRTPLAYRKQKT